MPVSGNHSIYFYNYCETALNTYHQKVKSAFTPLPSKHLGQELLQRIVLVASSILIYPILLIGIAAEKAYSFRANRQSKPVAEMPFPRVPVVETPSQQEIHSSDFLSCLLPEMQKSVIRKLSIQSFINLSRTCKKLRQQVLYVLLPSYINATNSSPQDFKFHPSILEYVFQHAGDQLTYLCLAQLTSTVAHRYISFCPNLTYLSIRNLKITTDLDDWFCPLVKQGTIKADKLKFLVLHSCEIRPSETEAIATLKNLAHFDLFHNSSIGEEGILALTEFQTVGKENEAKIRSSQLTQVTFLDLSHTGSHLKTLASRVSMFQALTHFIYNGGNNQFPSSTQINDFVSGLQKLSNLRSLSLVGNRLGDEGAQLIAQKLPNLNNLILDTNCITILGVVPIIKSFQELRKFEISINKIRIDEISQIVDLLLLQEDLLKFACCTYFKTAEFTHSEKETILTEQKTRLLEKFPQCYVSL
ncbi:MAG: F-box protein [Parachlamydiaceae bacterium]